MATVTLILHPFENGEAAYKAAEVIQRRGAVTYTDDSGAEVTVTIGHVAVNP